jgi:serine/threonine-protein kinase
MTCPHCKAANETGADVCFTCGRAFQALTQGAIVSSRYEVQSLLGRGGMGAVYRAHDRVLDETVALKVLRVDFAEDESLQKRFLQEIKLARKITHRNVCRIHEYGVDNGLHYISMAYVDGVDLKRLLRDGPLPIDEAFDAMIQVSEGLAAIHDEGVIHRDLKTPNILRDTKGVVRLLDFGIAKEWQAATEQGLTGTGLLIGTPEYMSPEQILAKKLDARSDLYSLGIVIFEVFTAQLPFKAESRVSLLQKHVTQPPPLQGPEAARLPKELVPLLRRAMAKEPPLRQANALEIADGLREAWEAVRARARPATGDAQDYIATERGQALPVTTAHERQPRPATDPGRRTRAARPTTSPIVQPSRPTPLDLDDEPRGMPWGWIAMVAALVVVAGIFWRNGRQKPATPVPEPVAADAAAPAPQAPTAPPAATVEYRDEPTASPAESRPSDAPPPMVAAAPAAEESRDSRLQRECSGGSMPSCSSLGEMHLQGDGVRQDTGRGVALLERACERDVARACMLLSRQYLHGQGVSRDPERALSLLKRACDGGEMQACQIHDDVAQQRDSQGGQGGGPRGGGGPGGGGGQRPPQGGGPR